MSIASRITSIEEHLKESYQELEGIGIDTTGVNNNLENIPKLLDGYWETLPKVTDEGTSITLDNTKEGKMKVLLKGNTSQDSTTGKNLFSGNYSQFDSTGGEGTTYGYFKLPKANTRYTLTVIAKKDFTPTNYTYLGFTGNGGNAQAGYYWIVAGNMETFVKGSTKSIGNLYGGNILEYVSLFNNNEQTLERFNEYFDIQLEEGKTGTDYEPYTNGPSPNPTYPQDIHIVSGDNTIVSTGKNYFDVQSVETTNTTNWTLTKTDTSVTIQHNNSYDTGSPKLELGVLESGNYVISFNSTNSKKLSIYKNNTYVSLISSGYTFTANGTDSYTFYFQVGASETQTFSNIQLEKGTTATTYQSYKRNDYKVNLPVKNLLDFDTILNYWGAVYTKENGTYSLADRGSFYANPYTLNLEVGKTYTLSGVKVAQTSGNLRLEVLKDSTIVAIQRFSNETTESGHTFTVEEGHTYKIRGNYSTGGYPMIISKPQLEEGTKANTYTPYGTTPIELCKIGTYQDKFIRTSGKNLFDENNMYIGYYNPIDITQMTQSTSYRTMIINNLPKGTYTFSTTLSNPRLLRVMYDNANHDIADNTNNYTFTSTTDGKVMLCFRNTSTSEITETFYTMLNEGTTALPYEPYGTGEWWLGKNIDKVVLNGSESGWALYNASGTAPRRFGLYPAKWYKNSIPLLSDYFIGGEYNSQIDLSMWTQTNYLAITDKNSKWSTAISLQTWLSTHNTEVYYVLETPTYTKIEGNLYNQLEAIKRSYEEQTNISQSNDDLPFELSVSALSQEV